jgi:hypothetical protein
LQAESKIRRELIAWEYPDAVGKKYLDAMKKVHPLAVPQQKSDGTYVRTKVGRDKTPLREAISKFPQFELAILALIEDIQLNAAE